MGKRIAAGLAVAIAAVLLAGCGGGSVSLATLAQKQQPYAGKHVSTSGTVRRQRDANGTTYFVLSDGRGDLVGLKPAAEARGYAGRHVDVSGRFEVQHGFGRVVLISSIRGA